MLLGHGNVLGEMRLRLCNMSDESVASYRTMQWGPSFEAPMSIGRFGTLLLDKCCLASEREVTSTIPALSQLLREV